MDFLIRPTSIDDAEEICNLRWDNSTRSYLHDPNQYSVKQCKKWIESLDNNPKSERLSIFEKFSADPRYLVNFIGLFRIDNIDHINNHCSVGLDITPKYRGKGLSKQIYKEILNQLFNLYNMNLLWLEVHETNKIAINLYTKLGFKIEVALRERILRNGKYISVLIMSLKKEEWLH